MSGTEAFTVYVLADHVRSWLVVRDDDLPGDWSGMTRSEIDDDVDQDLKVWLPKSQVAVLSGTMVAGEVADIELPRWLAEEKGWE